MGKQKLSNVPISEKTDFGGCVCGCGCVVCRGWNPGFCACQASAVTVSYILRLKNHFDRNRGFMGKEVKRLETEEIAA